MNNAERKRNIALSLWTPVCCFDTSVILCRLEVEFWDLAGQLPSSEMSDWVWACSSAGVVNKQIVGKSRLPNAFQRIPKSFYLLAALFLVLFFVFPLESWTSTIPALAYPALFTPTPLLEWRQSQTVPWQVRLPVISAAMPMLGAGELRYLGQLCLADSV